MRRFVVDCSVTMCWCFEDESDYYAIEILKTLPSTGAIVPAIWGLEVANAMLVAERRKRLTEAEGLRFLEFLRSLPISTDEAPPDQVIDDVLSLGRRYNLSSYDAAYLELAMRQGVPLATLDDRLRTAAQAVGVALVDV